MVTLWWLSTENLSREAVDVTAVLDVIEDTCWNGCTAV